MDRGYGCATSGDGSHTAQSCAMDIGQDWTAEVGFCDADTFITTLTLPIPGSFEFQGSIQENYTSAWMLAPLYQLVWKASDLTLTSSIPSLTQTASQPQSTSPALSATSVSNSSTGEGLSTGAKIALGVALPIGLIAISFVTAAVWLRRRKQGRMSSHTEQQRHELLDKSAYVVGNGNRKPYFIQEIGPGKQAELHEFGPGDQAEPRELMDRRYSQ